jgi:SOS-response transcriptional repressor LexA
MSDHLVRLHNLSTLMRANDWGPSELARQVGRSPQQVRSWFSGERQIGERLARSLEDKLELGRYALDDRAGLHQVGEPTPKWAVSSPLPSQVTKRQQERPVVRWTEIAALLDVDNVSLKQKAPHLGTHASTSTKAKFIEMPDDSMAPEFLAGDHVLFDPVEAPRAGDVVLVRVDSHEHFVRVFKPKTAHAFEASAINSNYQALSSDNDNLTVVSVNRTTFARGVHEQWVYDGGYLYFEDGVLTTIQN